MGLTEQLVAQSLEEGKSLGWKQGWVEGWKQGWKQGLEEGWEQGKKEWLIKDQKILLLEVAKDLLLIDFPVETISKISKLPIEDVLALQATLKTASD